MSLSSLDSMVDRSWKANGSSRVVVKAKVGERKGEIGRAHV